MICSSKSTWKIQIFLVQICLIGNSRFSNQKWTWGCNYIFLMEMRFLKFGEILALNYLIDLIWLFWLLNAKEFSEELQWKHKLWSLEMKVIFITKLIIMATTTHTPVHGTIHIHIPLIFIFCIHSTDYRLSLFTHEVGNCRLLCTPVKP